MMIADSYGTAWPTTLRDGALILDELHVAMDVEPPSLFGCAPEQPEQPVGFSAVYRELNHPVEFTGGLLLGDQFIQSLYVHMGFHPAWKYEQVLEVELGSGHVETLSDCSQAMADVRSKLAGRDVPGNDASEAELRAWIDKAFSRTY